MRPPRFRLRTLMVAVVFAAVALGGFEMLRRRERFLALAAYHASRAVSLTRYYSFFFPRKLPWHLDMQRKYERAATRPWLPIAPDPPPPD